MDASAVLLASVTADPIATGVLRDAVAASTHGAVVVFEGIVRDHDHGRTVTGLEYQAHPEAERFLSATCTAVLAEHPGVRIATAHRHGALQIGDVAFVVAVGAPHRGDAFLVCSLLVDRVKAELPIWKRQQFADGTHEWVNFA